MASARWTNDRGARTATAVARKPTTCAALLHVAVAAVVLSGCTPSSPIVVSETSSRHSAAAPTPGETIHEDVVTVPIGQPYRWPSGVVVGVSVAVATSRVPPDGDGRLRTVVVTTVTNGTSADFDVGSLMGPFVRHGVAEVAALSSVRHGIESGGSILQPGARVAFTSFFDPVRGNLAIEYRSGFQYPAVVFVGGVG